MRLLFEDASPARPELNDDRPFPSDQTLEGAARDAIGLAASS
jgi:hypothetical protein